MINIIHYTVWSPFHSAHYECSPVHLDRPYKLTHTGAERILKREGLAENPSVTRIETAHRS
jgi:hypothetical protein